MQILVDADACPVKEIILDCAKQYCVMVHMVCDVTHILSYPQDFVQTTTVDKGADSADLYIANLAVAGDIGVTSDYGLATLLLAKGCIVLHPNGFCYTNENIDRMLFERHISREMRKKHKRHGGHIAKRTSEADITFQNLLLRILQTQKTNESHK